MRILLTSDLHGNLPEIPECDILIIAGDICPDFIGSTRVDVDSYAYVRDNGETKQAVWYGTVFRKWLEQIPAKEIVAIGGNHDYLFERPQIVPVNMPWNYKYLQDAGTVIKGIKIWGTPWVPNLPMWAFYGGMEGVDPEKLDRIPSDTDILISHGPPRGFGDRLHGGSKWGNEEEMRVGCIHMNHTLARVQPKLFVTGHIHEGFGNYRHPHVEHGVYNVSFVDEFYTPRDVIEEFTWDENSDTQK